MLVFLSKVINKIEWFRARKNVLFGHPGQVDFPAG